MKIVNISEAKANLSKLVALVYRGEKVVIAKNNLPLVDLVIHKPEGRRKLGLLSGRLSMPKNIMDEDEEINSIAGSFNAKSKSVSIFFGQDQQD